MGTPKSKEMPRSEFLNRKDPHALNTFEGLGAHMGPFHVTIFYGSLSVTERRNAPSIIEENMEEKRRSPRFSVSGIVEINPVGSTDQFKASIRNLSKGGIAFYSGIPFSINQDLRMRLTLEKEPQIQNERIFGRVVHCVDWDLKFMVGVQFNGVSAAAAPRLMAFLEGLEQKGERPI